MALSMMKFHVEDRKERIVVVGVVKCDQQASRECCVRDEPISKTHKRVGDSRSNEDEMMEHKREETVKLPL